MSRNQAAATAAIAECQSKITLGTPQIHQNLSLFPLLGDRRCRRAGLSVARRSSDTGLRPRQRGLGGR